MKILTERQFDEIIRIERNKMEAGFLNAQDNFQAYLKGQYDKQLLVLTDKLSASEKQREFLQSKLDARFPSLGPDTLTEKQLNQFFQCDKSLPLWRGVMEIINRACRNAAQRVATEQMDDNTRAHCAGGLDWMLDVQSVLTQLQENAAQNETDDNGTYD